MNGFLVRVGIDSTDGRWVAPVRTATWDFAYITITENNGRKLRRHGIARYYDEFEPVLSLFNEAVPPHLKGQLTHLDPDFDWLTYGDQGRRGKQIQTLSREDLLVFYGALRPVDAQERPLVYAIIGLYVIDEIVPACSIPESRWPENAHTRREPLSDDIVVRARRGVSGRLRHCLPIGEWRDSCYRVMRDLLGIWGGLDVEDGYIQRSAHLPKFLDTDRFYRWVCKQDTELIATNNPIA